MQLVSAAADRIKQPVAHSDTLSMNTSQMNSFELTLSSGIKNFTRFSAFQVEARRRLFHFMSGTTIVRSHTNQIRVSQNLNPCQFVIAKESMPLVLQPDLVTHKIDSDGAVFELLLNSYQDTRGNLSYFSPCRIFLL